MCSASQSIGVRRCVRDRALDVVPRPHHQRVAHDQPAGVGLPGGLQDQAARQVAAGRRAPRRRTGPAGSARRRGPGSRRTRWASRAAARTAIPPIPLDEIRQVFSQSDRKRVVGDRRKRVPQPARRVGHRRGRVGLHSGAVRVGGRRMLQDHVHIIDRRPDRRRRLRGTASRPLMAQTAYRVTSFNRPVATSKMNPRSDSCLVTNGLASMRRSDCRTSSSRS